ncbi:MAG: cytochrome d ubiquinol oxidase subunit II [Candidatus Dormibacteraceae bacterium]
MSQQALVDIWFCVVTLFWCGYLFLEGFDFGVGMLLPLLGREGQARSAMIGSIGPVWDGNEVWLIVAVGATFAAFPSWYATLLSACYPVLFLTLVTLILRVVAFEFRGKASAAWKRWWDRALMLGSLVPPLAWGLILTVQLTGLPVTAEGTFTGRPWDVLGALPILGAITFAVLFVLHGATYLSLRTTDPLSARARRTATLVWVPALVLLCALFVSLLLTSSGARGHGAFSYALPIATVLALIAALALHLVRRDGLAFLATGLVVVGLVVTLFLGLYPRVVVSSIGAGDTLTALGTASAHYSLSVLSVAALIFAPLVILYQAWTYWVFRKRLSSRPAERPRAAVQKT